MDDTMGVMSEELISAYDIRGTEAAGLTIECAWNVGKALADWLPTSGRVLVVTNQAQTQLAQAVIEGLRLQGRAVIDAGEMTKEAVVEQITAAGLSGAAIVGFDALDEASTIELYENEGRLVTSETGLTSIRELVQAGNFVPAVIKGDLATS